MELQIHYIGYQNRKHMFEVIRSSDMKRTEATPLPDASAFQVKGQPAKQFLPELCWYLEDYLQAPFGAFQQSAECVQETIRAWGTDVFDALFTERARDWYQDARTQGLENLRIKIASDSPEILSWPWETLYSRDDAYLAMRCCIDRQLSDIADPLPLPNSLAQDAIHILYVIPRPYGDKDINYHALSKSLIDYISQNHLPVTVDVLRPPTFARLQRVLDEHPGYYHIVHFDGHGGYGAVTPGNVGNLYAGPEGQLVFETDDGGPDLIDTTRLSQLLAEYKIPIMVMNACQSGMIDTRAKDPFASVATGLLKAGIRSVVAMGYSLYVSGAKEFVPAFYERLFSSGKVSEAVRAGRKKMLERPKRDCILGSIPLQDWVVPVLYQQMSSESEILPKVRRGAASSQNDSVLPQDARVVGDYGFIGRGRSILELERAALRQPQAGLLIHGQAGTGKTTLAKGFLHWLKDTNGLQEQAFWFNFQDIHSAEYIVNALVGELVDFAAVAKRMEEKLELLKQALYNRPYWIVWDNFESVSGIDGTDIQPNLSEENRSILLWLLQELRNGKSKILITSRTKEAWLPLRACFRITLEGLTGEDLWEYCNAVVRDLGLTFDRHNETYVKIMDRLCGNPLAIRAILLRLEDCTASELLAELDTAFHGFEGDESTRRLQAAYKVFSGSFSERFLPILQVTGLHEYYADIRLIKDMLDKAECPIEYDAIRHCYHILENSGFCTNIGENIYRLHPALRGYLLQQTPAPEKIQEGFVGVMGGLAGSLLCVPFHKSKFYQQLHLANLYHAQKLAENRWMEMRIALTESLWNYAMGMRQFAEAHRLSMMLVEIGESDNLPLASADAFHQLGMNAEKQRRFDEAKSWYIKSLEIREKYGHYAASTYDQLGNIAREQRHFEEAEGWYKKSLAIEEKRDNEQGAAIANHQMGVIKEEQGHFEEAEAWYKKALKIWEKLGDELHAASTYHQLGSIALRMQRFREAKNCFKKSLEITEKYGDKHNSALAYHHLGIIAQMQRHFVEAECWYKKALEIREEHGNEHYAAATCGQLGILAQKLRHFDEAEGWYKKSLAIMEKYGDKRNAALACHQLGMIAKEQGDFQQAAIYYLKSLEKFLRVSDQHTCWIAAFNYAILLRAAPAKEQTELRKMWSARMPEELTKILEQMEAKLNETGN